MQWNIAYTSDLKLEKKVIIFGVCPLKHLLYWKPQALGQIYSENARSKFHKDTSGEKNIKFKADMK